MSNTYLAFMYQKNLYGIIVCDEVVFENWEYNGRMVLQLQFSYISIVPLMKSEASAI